MISNTNNLTLLVRPPMLADEWFDSYLVRLARANGRSKPATKDVELLRQRYVNVRRGDTNLPQNYLTDVPLWAKKKLNSVIRYCPACFEKERYVRARWRLTSYEVCTRHNLNLKRGVIEPALQQVVNHRNTAFLADTNEQQIWDGASCPLPEAKQHAAHIWSDFESSLEAGEHTRSHECLAWALIAEYLLDAAVTAELGYEVPLKGDSRIHHRTRWLRENNASLSASKDGILRFLLSIKMNGQRRAAAFRLREIIQQPKHGSTLFSGLPLQELYDRLLAAAPETNALISYGVLPSSLHPAGYVSVNYAEAILGKRTEFIQCLTRANFFQKIHQVQFGRRLYTFIQKSEIEACRRWLSECMTPEETMRHLDIDRPMYFALQRNDLLQPIVIKDWSFLRNDDIATLTSKLDSIARPHRPELTQLLPLVGPWIRIRGQIPLAYDSLLKEIWRGDFPVYRKLDEQGLRAYYVDAKVAVRAQQLRSEMAFSRIAARRKDWQLSFQEFQ